MARTFHAVREEHRTGRVTRAQFLRAAGELVSELDRMAERRAVQHAAEMVIANARANGVDLEGLYEREVTA